MELSFTHIEQMIVSICGDIEINNDSSITMFDSSDLNPVYCVGIVLV